MCYHASKVTINKTDMDEQKQKLIDRITQAQNILVTVSANPSVDQLSAAIGLTLVLNQMDKHGTAVFSGQVPSTIEFLKPEATLEKNTDSLRDFIIALDKSKADKLRYKVEDEVVRIFITPYKTSLSEKDLDFSQGDFNVDVVVCLGVNEQQDLDTAITAHGRILHDATVVSISTVGQGGLGSINWVDPNASSLSEMMVSLTDGLSKKAMNNQVATALLTGIVANTERFRNDKTTPRTMSAAAALMAAGANQQLIATELEAPAPEPEEPSYDAPQPPAAADKPRQDEKALPKHKAEPGTLEIAHDPNERTDEFEPEPEPAPEPEQPQIHVDENGQIIVNDEPKQQETFPAISQVRGVASNGNPTESAADTPKAPAKTEVHRELMTKMPELTQANITANIEPESEEAEKPTEELTLPALDSPLLSHNESVLPPPSSAAPSFASSMPAPQTPAPATPPLFSAMPPAEQQAPQPPALPQIPPTETLTEIEQSVSSPHLHTDDAPQAAAPDAQISDARSAVEAALSGANLPAEPIAALNAQPLGAELHDASQPEPATPYIPPANLFSPAPAEPQQQSPVPNAGFSEPSPGNTPADDSLDMPLPTNAFAAPGQAAPGVPGMSMGPAPASPSAFPGSPAQGMNMGGQTPPPPVPPPMLPPLQ